jgi:tetratricopeptide (TPR) repeat protein
MTRTIQSRRLMLILGITPVLAGAWLGSYAWRSQANQAYRYPYAVTSSNPRSLQNEVNFYTERIQRHPSDGLDRAALATTYLKLARSTGDSNYYHLAEETARQSLAKLPMYNTAAQLVLARVAEAEHDFPTTFKVIDQVLQTQPHHPDAQTLLVTSQLAVGRLPEASQTVQHLVAQTPTLGTYTLQALVHAAQGQDDQAIQAFQQALAAEEPGEVASSAKTRTLLGRFYAQRGQAQLARQLFQEALRIVPNDVLARVEQAKLETQQGNYQQAEAIYAQISETPATTNGLDHEVIQGQALLKALQGDRAAANQLWAKAEQDFYRGHEHEDEHRSEDHHEHGDEHEHGDDHGSEHSHSQQHDKAAHANSQNHEPEEEHASFGHRRDLARVLLTRGTAPDISAALVLMQAEVQIRRDVETLEVYAWALQQSDRAQEAQTVLQEAMKMGTRDAKLFYRASKVEQLLGNRQQAQVYLETAQAINPHFDRKLRQMLQLG